MKRSAAAANEIDLNSKRPRATLTSDRLRVSGRKRTLAEDDDDQSTSGESVSSMDALD